MMGWMENKPCSYQNYTKDKKEKKRKKKKKKKKKKLCELALQHIYVSTHKELKQ